MLRLQLTILMIAGSICITARSHAQTAVKPMKQVQTAKGPMAFPELIMTEIPGAPKLGMPTLISGKKGPIIAEGMGLAAPAFYDWDGDGLKDLLIGEFGSGTENGRNVGNFVRVYKNIGTESAPEFSGTFDYARAPFEMPGNGTPYSVSQYCCIGFTPQFTDLNQDGQMDMITGSYYGEVYWFEGSKQGFKEGVPVKEELPAVGDPRNKNYSKKAHQFYWLYSSASFGDLTGDGKPDMVVGGRTLRMAKNIGTESGLKFSQRELLLNVNGKPLKIYDLNKEDLKFYEDRKVLGYEPPPSGDVELSPYTVDWDNDGIQDILATNSYMHHGLSTVNFFKGVKTAEGIRFQPAVPLFSVKNEGKAFPGMGPRISVTDWNNDGVNDLLIGTAVITIKAHFNDQLSWHWQDNNKIPGAGKVASLADILPTLSQQQQESERERLKKDLPPGISLDEYLTMRHQGYVYVMLGKK